MRQAKLRFSSGSALNNKKEDVCIAAATRRLPPRSGRHHVGDETQHPSDGKSSSDIPPMSVLFWKTAAFASTTTTDPVFYPERERKLTSETSLKPSALALGLVISNVTTPE